MSGYPLRSGAPVSRTVLGRATEVAYKAASHLTVASAFNGTSDWRRDEALDAAADKLREALRLIDEARNPTPPATPANYFDVAREIVSGQPEGVPA